MSISLIRNESEATTPLTCTTPQSGTPASSARASPAPKDDDKKSDEAATTTTTAPASKETNGEAKPTEEVEIKEVR
jgi:hypothetical protein